MAGGQRADRRRRASSRPTRARGGRRRGWDLQFVVAPNAEYVGLAAGGGADHAGQIIVLGPSRITDLAVHEIDLTLDALQRGDRQIILDEDGDPRLIWTSLPPTET